MFPRNMSSQIVSVPVGFVAEVTTELKTVYMGLNMFSHMTFVFPSSYNFRAIVANILSRKVLCEQFIELFIQFLIVKNIKVF